MSVSNARIWRGFFATVALFWTGFGLLCSLQAVLPARTFTLWALTVVAKESSLLVAAFASIGVAQAALAGLSGARKRALVAAAMGTAAVVVSLAPLAQASRTAVAEGVTLSLAEHFEAVSFTVEGDPETATYAFPDGASDGLKLDVWRPSPGGSAADEANGRPAVILVHGGGWRTGGRSQTPRWDAWLAELGYVVFDVDYRLTPPPRWQDAPGDVKCAVGWVKRNADRYGVDPDRVALLGFSAGGHLALLSAFSEDYEHLPPSCAVEDTGVAAVAAFYPPTDLERLHGMEWPWSSPNVVGLVSTERFLGGTPHTHLARYRVSSPISHVDPTDPPTFLVHGGADRLVPLEQSERLARRLEEAGVHHRLVELPWANHAFDHAFDFSWSGWGGQISRSALEEFLGHHLAEQTPPRLRTAGPRETGETGVTAGERALSRSPTQTAALRRATGRGYVRTRA